MGNNSVLSVRLPDHLLENLINMYPDSSMRSDVIRKLIEALVQKKIRVRDYEVTTSRI